MEERKNRGWSQQELADFLGTTQHNVSRWEAGLTTPGPYFRTRLGEVFGIPIQELLLRESNTHSLRGGEGEIVTQLFLDFKQQTRQAALTGEWSGTVRDDGRELEYQVTLQFKLVGRTLRGEGHLHEASESRGPLTQSVTMGGRLVYERFLALEYTLREPLGALQFGFALLEFAPDGQTLEGGFVGYGALVTKGIVTGTVYLQRQRTHEMRSKSIGE